MDSEYEVLVVGAGPVGLLLSITLATRGIKVGLIEKLDEPMAGSKGKGIQPRTQEVLEQLQLLEHFLAIGSDYPGFRIYKSDGVREEPYAVKLEPTPEQPYPNILMVPQSRNEDILRKRLEDLNVDVLFGHELVRLEQDNDGVVATIASPHGMQIVKARYLVGTDGGRSFVRQAIEVPFSGVTLPRRAIFADVKVNGLATDVWHRWPETETGEFTLCPLLGTNLFQMAAEVSPDGAIDLSKEAVAALVRSRVDQPDIRVLDVEWSSLLQGNLRLADRYHVGRVFLAGDAAHVHPPTGAQGLNTGMQDAFNLGWKLAIALRGGDPVVLDSYEAERRPIAEDMIALTGSLLKAWKEQKKTQRGTLTSQLGLNYRGSSLAFNGCDREGKLQAGDRAPDSPCKDAKGTPIRLFELLQHPDFTLLGYDVTPASLDAIAAGTSIRRYTINGSKSAVIDDQGMIQKNYGLDKGTLVLIRPDGYIGAMADESGVEEMGRLLRKWTGERRANAY